MVNDFPYILTWWFQLFIIGIIFLPLTTLIFRNFFDKGYAFSKILGLALSSYLLFTLSSFKILPFSQLSIFIILFVFFVINTTYYILHTTYYKTLKGFWRIFIFEELLFFLGLFFWSYVRAHEPSINGLEKFMDYGFVNSILRTKYFPPLDMWLSGKNYINYYYYGHYVCAFLTKLSNIPSEITYNLRLADILGLSFAATFSLAGNLVYNFLKGSDPQEMNLKTKSQSLLKNSLAQEKFRGWGLEGRTLIGGLLAATLLNLGGNFHTIVYVLKEGVAKYWYPNATRYIPFTIHEFPSYSYIVADLHGHLSDIPFVLLTIALIYLLFSFVKNSPSHLKIFLEKKFSLIKKAIYPHSLLILLSLMVTINAMTNFWDLPIYLILAGLVFLYFNYQRYGLTFTMIIETGIPCLALLILHYLFFFPFSRNFIPFFKGIDIVEAHSPFYMLLVLWGFFYFFVICFLLFLYGEKLKAFIKPEKIVKNLIKSLANLFSIPIKILEEKEGKLKKEILDTDIFILILISLSTFLIIFPEFLYIKDIYIREYHRANTMFKLVYQSFMMLAIISAYTTIRILTSENRKSFFSRLFYFLFFIFYFCVMIYPYFGVNSYYGGLKNYLGLNGINYLKTRYPDDYQGLLWIRKNVSGQPTILEAVGESYTDYARISANTGIPTVLGWPVHEWLWRGSYDEAGKRTAEVQTIYTSKDLNQVKSLLKKYNISYVFLGTLEKQKYQNLNEENFKKLGKVVFKSGGTKIYKITL